MILKQDVPERPGDRPLRLLIKRIVTSLLASAALGCATRSPIASPGEASHGQIAFPQPDRETCASGGRTPYRLSVRLRDEQGAPFPGAHVFLFPMGPGAEKLVTVRANQGGVAIAVATEPGVYAVVAAVGGFEPQVRALTLRAGCSGWAEFTLKLGPVAGG